MKPANLPELPERPRIRKPWERDRQITFNEMESKTDTSQGNSTDVNVIVERFARTGMLPPTTLPGGREPQFADVTGLQKDLTTLIEDGKSALDDLKIAETKHKKQKQQETTDKITELEKELKEAKNPPEIPEA